MSRKSREFKAWVRQKNAERDPFCIPQHKLTLRRYRVLRRVEQRAIKRYNRIYRNWKSRRRNERED